MSPATTARTNRWLLRPPSAQARTRLFCLPYPGCGATMYRRWPRYLGTTEICPVQMPGRENRLREPLPATFEELADALIDGLTPVLDRPFALFGHCGAAVSAFVAAQRLCARGTPPVRLFVSSQPAPHDGAPSRFLGLADDTLRTELSRMIRELGGDPVPAFVELGLRVLRADVEVHRRYLPPSPVSLGCPITVLAWRGDTEVPADGLHGWSAYGPARYHHLDGEHFSFLEAPAELRDVLSADLAAGTGHEQRKG
jgi:surfactin synthase thioesterase subunit